MKKNFVYILALCILALLSLTCTKTPAVRLIVAHNATNDWIEASLLRYYDAFSGNALIKKGGTMRASYSLEKLNSSASALPDLRGYGIDLFAVNDSKTKTLQTRISLALPQQEKIDLCALRVDNTKVLLDFFENGEAAIEFPATNMAEIIQAAMGKQMSDTQETDENMKLLSAIRISYDELIKWYNVQAANKETKKNYFDAYKELYQDAVFEERDGYIYFTANDEHTRKAAEKFIDAIKKDNRLGIYATLFSAYSKNIEELKESFRENIVETFGENAQYKERGKIKIENGIIRESEIDFFVNDTILVSVQQKIGDGKNFLNDTSFGISIVNPETHEVMRFTCTLKGKSKDDCIDCDVKMDFVLDEEKLFSINASAFIDGTVSKDNVRMSLVLQTQEKFSVRLSAQGDFSKSADSVRYVLNPLRAEIYEGTGSNGGTPLMAFDMLGEQSISSKFEKLVPLNSNVIPAGEMTPEDWKAILTNIVESLSSAFPKED